jgi:hypothetical protein
LGGGGNRRREYLNEEMENLINGRTRKEGKETGEKERAKNER